MATVNDIGIATLEEDYATCKEIMHQASKNYTFASYFMPADRSPHVEALYAVLRVGDDRVDVQHDGFASPQAAIEDWQESYFQAFQQGDSPYAVLRAYIDTCHKFDIPSMLLDSYFRAMIDDLTVTRYETFADLLHYIEGSAIPVGRGMAHILGAVTPQISDVYPEADALSIAMQLSNFWRDIGEDWEIGRVYIPQEDLASFGYSEKDLMAGRINGHFIDMLEFEFARTEVYYNRACNGVALLASGRWSVMSALEIYRAIMPAIRRNGYDVFNYRAGTTKWQKLKLVLRALRNTNQPAHHI